MLSHAGDMEKLPGEGLAFTEIVIDADDAFVESEDATPFQGMYNYYARSNCLQNYGDRWESAASCS